MAFSFFICGWALQFYILLNGMWKVIINKEERGHKIEIDITTLIFANFGAAAALITYSCLLGKITPF